MDSSANLERAIERVASAAQERARQFTSLRLRGREIAETAVETTDDTMLNDYLNSATKNCRLGAYEGHADTGVRNRPQYWVGEVGGPSTTPRQVLVRGPSEVVSDLPRSGMTNFWPVRQRPPGDRHQRLLTVTRAVPRTMMKFAEERGDVARALGIALKRHHVAVQRWDKVRSPDGDVQSHSSRLGYDPANLQQRLADALELGDGVRVADREFTVWRDLEETLGRRGIWRPVLLMDDVIISPTEGLQRWFGVDYSVLTAEGHVRRAGAASPEQMATARDLFGAVVAGFDKQLELQNQQLSGRDLMH